MPLPQPILSCSPILVYTLSHWPTTTTTTTTTTATTTTTTTTTATTTTTTTTTPSTTTTTTMTPRRPLPRQPQRQPPPPPRQRPTPQERHPRRPQQRPPQPQLRQPRQPQQRPHHHRHNFDKHHHHHYHHHNNDNHGDHYNDNHHNHDHDTHHHNDHHNNDDHHYHHHHHHFHHHDNHNDNYDTTTTTATTTTITTTTTTTTATTPPTTALDVTSTWKLFLFIYYYTSGLQTTLSYLQSYIVVHIRCETLSSCAHSSIVRLLPTKQDLTYQVHLSQPPPFLSTINVPPLNLAMKAMCVCHTLSLRVPYTQHWAGETSPHSSRHGCCFPSHANEAMGISWMGMWTHVPVPACAGHGRRCAQLGSTRPLMGVRGRSLGAERITDSPWASLCAAGMSITFPSSFSFQTVCFQPAFLTHQLRQLP